MPAHSAINSCMTGDDSFLRLGLFARPGMGSLSAAADTPCATALIIGPKKTPKKIATRNDGFSGFAAPATAFRTGQMG